MTLTLALIGLVDSEEKMFENVDGRRMNMSGPTGFIRWSRDVVVKRRHDKRTS